MSRGAVTAELMQVGCEFVTRFGLAERIIRNHSPDGRRRCRGCTLPGYGTPHAVWPCLIHEFATGAAAAG
jgi:hypothetical protein